MTLQEIAASIAALHANKRRAVLENKPELCEGYQQAIDLLDELAEIKKIMKRRKQWEVQIRRKRLARQQQIRTTEND